MNIDAIIEIPFNTNIKYEYDKSLNFIRVDRILQDNMFYPCNYGYIPNTLAKDGDPLDILVLSNYPINPCSVIEVKILGVLIMEDENGLDEKVISIPSENVDTSSMNINTLNDLSDTIKENIKYFFKNYKNSSIGKWSKVYDYKGIKEAIDIINKYKTTGI